ncbi:MAG: phosphatidylserine decarboxylase [Roseburia sp.]|nr:phosphatidylserine decarboxylase [Roseburia sp.]
MKQIDIYGKKTDTDSGQDKLLHFMYMTPVGRLLLKPLVSPLFSKIAGNFLNTRFSCHFIEPFIRSNNIDMADFEERPFTSYNDFFTRRIKPGKRMIPEDEKLLISPCDSFVTVYPITEQLSFDVKNTEYTVRSLLHSQKLAKRFEGGYALIFRLTVSDYHRYCYAVSGTQAKNYFIPGTLHTVNPVANDCLPVYKENSREYTLIHSDWFGEVLQMEVGALMVGKIVNHKASCLVRRGEEKGYFEFGGSTIILLLQKDAVKLREDLLPNTEAGYETQVRLGDAIGSSLR